MTGSLIYFSLAKQLPANLHHTGKSAFDSEVRWRSVLVLGILIGIMVSSVVHGQEGWIRQNSGTSNQSEGLSSGIYFNKLQTKKYSETGKLILHKQGMD